MILRILEITISTEYGSEVVGFYTWAIQLEGVL